MKYRTIIGITMICGMLTACGSKGNVDDVPVSDTGVVTNAPGTIDQGATAATTLLSPEDFADYRKIPDEVPEAVEEAPNPGSREHFSFTDGEDTYVFTETETIWLYYQSEIHALDTEFMLNLDGRKITLSPVSKEDRENLSLSLYQEAYSDDTVTIYHGKKEASSDEGSNTDEEKENASGENQAAEPSSDEPADTELMYLTLYDLVYQVEGWEEEVGQNTLSLDTLYEGLAEMGTAVKPAAQNESLTNVLQGLRNEAVLDQYKLAYRKGISHTGFIICSPNSDKADHDSFSIYMSLGIPDWDTYAIVHMEAAPDFVNRLDKTKESFEDYSIMADYTESLKYFLLGEDGRCIWIEGVPGEAASTSKAFTPKEAKYIFELLLTE